MRRIPGVTIITRNGIQTAAAAASLVPKRAAILVISDTAYTGTRALRACEAVRKELEQQSIISEQVEFLPNDPAKVESRISQLKSRENIDIIVTTGAVFKAFKDSTTEKQPHTDLWYDFRIPSS